MADPSFPLDPLARPSPGRGSGLSPQNRFLPIVSVPDPEYFEDQPEERPGERRQPTRFLADASQSVVSENDSPDVFFRYSLNPYRGCEHGCIYCFARPTHAYLGLSPGLDFETKLLFKPDAAKLLTAELAAPKYRCDVLAMGTNTDPYQPVERELKIGRAHV